MNDDTEITLSVSEFVEYCRTQAGLLSGTVETMRDEANDLLDEIDAELAELRSQLEDQSGRAATETPTSADGPDGSEGDIDTIEAVEQELAEKQTLVDAKQARMQAYQELSSDYADLAEELHAEVDDGQEAMTRVIEFEAEADAPAYFTDRQTVYEAALESQDEPSE